MFEANNKTIPLIVFFHEVIGFSKHNSELENELIRLLTTDGKKWYYLAINCFSKSLPEITSKNNSD